MANLRSWNRREFSVTQAGFFTVLKSNGWFSALRLPGGFRYLVGGRPEDESLHKSAPASAQIFNQAGAQQIPLRIVSPSENRSPIRFALLALAATVITLVLLYQLK